MFHMKHSGGKVMGGCGMGEDGRMDERERLFALGGGTAAFAVVFVGAVLLGLVKEFVLGVPSGDLFALAFAGMAVVNAYQYVQLKAGANLSAAALFFAGAALFAFGFADATFGIL